MSSLTARMKQVILRNIHLLAMNLKMREKIAKIFHSSKLQLERGDILLDSNILFNMHHKSSGRILFTDLDNHTLLRDLKYHGTI